MKSRRLIWQLYPSYLLMILLVLLAVSWYVSGELRSFHYRQTADDLRARAQLIEPQLQGQLSDSYQVWLSQLLRRLGQQSATRITIVLKDGRVLADSQEDALQMDNHGQRPEILQAFAGERGQSIRFSNTLGQSLMYVALPVYADGQLVGSVRTALPVSAIDATLKGINRQLLVGGLLIAALLAPLCWWLSRRLSRPLELMTAGAQRFARGDLGNPLHISGCEETERLATAMNRMAVELAERIDREVEQRGEIEAILGCMSEGVVAVDHQERVIRMNLAAAELFGVSARQRPGRPIQELVRQPELQRIIRKALSKPGPHEDEVVMHGQNRRYLHVLTTPLAGNGDARTGVLIVLHDLTRLRQLESLRRDFVANVSHELKTPITAIRGAVETLLDDSVADQVTGRFLQIIFKQNQRLNALVEDLLDLSRIEQGVNEGRWELTTAALLPVLEGARLACETLLNRQQIELTLNCAESLQAKICPALLEQAIINLLTNAIKYSEPNGRIVIEAADQGKLISLRVQDFGCGIDPVHLPRLFERFYRVDSARSRHLGGTGLGLAIVKHVVQAHRGEVQVSSRPGAGSSFTLLLPKN